MASIAHTTAARRATTTAAARSPYQLKRASTLTNSTANQFLRMAKTVDKQNAQSTGVGAYRVLGNAAKAGETESARYERILKRVLHHDYPITGDDGGYSFTPLAKTATARDIDGLLGNTQFTDSDESNSQVKRAALAAVKAGLTVLIGDGSGNNTMATIVAVIDPKAKELAYVMNSNFGSDD